jgi:plastocyanin
LRLALATAALAALAAAAPAVAGAPARVQVGADEFHLTLSRSSIKAGTAIVELANYGEDPHDLRMLRKGGTRTYAIGVVQPGDAVDLTAKLLPGTYTLWCSLADHRRRGMQAALVVKK